MIPEIPAELNVNAAMQDDLELLEAKMKVFCHENGLDYMIAQKSINLETETPQTLIFYNGPLFDKFKDDVVSKMAEVRNVMISALSSLNNSFLQLCQKYRLGLVPLTEVNRLLEENKALHVELDALKTPSTSDTITEEISDIQE
jgi:hypothetical protein